MPESLQSLEGDWIACDTECTGLSTWLGDRPFAASFCNEKGETRFLRTEVDGITRQPKWNPQQIRQFREFFGDKRRRFGFFNAHFDVRQFESVGVNVPHEKVDDVMFMMHALNSGEMSFKLKPLAKKYADFPDDDEHALQKAVMRARRIAKAKGWSLGEDLKQDYWLPEARTECDKYAVGDAERTALLHILAKEKMPEMNVQSVYDDEMELWPIVYEMMTRGIKFNPEENAVQIKAWETKSAKALANVRAIAGVKTFDPKKDREVAFVLYKKLGIRAEHFTEKTNSPAVHVEALKNLTHPIGRAILEYRAAEKALATYFYRYQHTAAEEEEGWVIHPDFFQMGPRTGRFSCRNPNMQNVADALATRSPIPIQARTPFGPRPGYYWYSIDYEQIETRIFAALANEEEMLRALREGRHIHEATAQVVWPEEWEEDQRLGRHNTKSRAKMYNFGVIYGIGPGSLAKLIGHGCTKEKAKEDLDAYKRRFKNIDRYMRKLSSTAKRDGEIRTLYGRRVPVDMEYAYRAVNYMVQGTAADVLKRAMIAAHKYLKRMGADAHLVLTIHDELIFEWNKNHAYTHLLKGTQREMEDHGGKLSIAIPTAISRIDKRWDLKTKLAA